MLASKKIFERDYTKFKTHTRCVVLTLETAVDVIGRTRPRALKAAFMFVTCCRICIMTDLNSWKPFLNANTQDFNDVSFSSQESESHRFTLAQSLHFEVF